MKIIKTAKTINPVIPIQMHNTTGNTTNNPIIAKTGIQLKSIIKASAILLSEFSFFMKAKINKKNPELFLKRVRDLMCVCSEHKL